MTTNGWRQMTLWLVGNRLPMGDAHDGQGHRPQVRAAFGPHGQPGLVISDEQQNVYFAAVQGSRLTHRHWLKLTSPNETAGQAIGGGGSEFCDNYHYAAFHYPAAGFGDVTLEGTTRQGDPLSASAVEANLVQSHFAQNQVVLHAHASTAASLTYQAEPRLLVNQRGVPEVIHWRRDAAADLLLAMEDGTIRRWQGLEDANLSPLPGAGEHVLAGDEPIAFDGLVHLSVVDWNMRGKSDLLIATQDGELWLFYDVGSEKHVAYDCGRRLCDAHGPIQLFGAASATLLRQNQERWLVAADGQGQLWHWQLQPTSSWVVTDWSQAAHPSNNNRSLANAYEPGHWWVGKHNDSPDEKPVLRIGPSVLDHVTTNEQPLAFAPLPPELSIASPCTGPCEIHVTLASLASVFKPLAETENDESLLPWESMIDVRVGGQIHPQLVSAGKLPHGCTKEIYWGTADLSDNPICLRGLHGGFLFEGGLPAAVVSLRVVPLTPQEPAFILGQQKHTQENAGDSNQHKQNTVDNKSADTSSDHPQSKIVLQDHPPISNATTQDKAGSSTSKINETYEDAAEDDVYDDDEDDLDTLTNTYVQDDPSKRIPLAGLLQTFGWTSTMRADSAQEVDELIARHQEAGFGRLYWRIGAGPWEYPSRVPGAQNTVPHDCNPQHEALAQRQADLFEHVNRLELASAAAERRGMDLFAWLGLHHQSEHQPPGRFESVDQFTLDHPQYLEKDVHGRPHAGKLCLGYEQVREFLIKIVLETMEMGIDGLMIDMIDHLPRVQYGDPIVAEFKQRHHCEMRSLSPFDLRVVEMQSMVLSRFMRELRDAVHHARPRQRLPIHVRVARPYVLMGCDPATWAREHLIDAIIVDTPPATPAREQAQVLASMAHLVEDTSCEIAAAIDTPANASQSRHSRRLANQVQKQVELGASFIVFHDTASLIRDRNLCQLLKRINSPDEHQPRSVLA